MQKEKKPRQDFSTSQAAPLNIVPTNAAHTETARINTAPINKPDAHLHRHSTRTQDAETQCREKAARPPLRKKRTSPRRTAIPGTIIETLINQINRMGFRVAGFQPAGSGPGKIAVMFRPLLSLRKLMPCLALCGLAVFLTSCAQWNSIFRTHDFEHGMPIFGESVLIDAKQRAIISVDRLPDKENEPRVVVCAEPSPDALSAYASELVAEFDKSEFASAALEAAFEESSSSIGLRTQTIQLLRDQGYRLCEAYAAGAIQQEDFEKLIRRHQRSMITLLAIESLTGTVTARAEALSQESPATTYSNIAKGYGQQIADNQKEITHAKTEKARLEKLENSNDEAIRKLITAQDKIITDLTRNNQSLQEKRQQALDKALLVPVADQTNNFNLSLNGLDEENIEYITGTVKSLALLAFEDDGLTYKCLTYLEGEYNKNGLREEDSSEKMAFFEQYCKDIFDAKKESDKDVAGIEEKLQRKLVEATSEVNDATEEESKAIKTEDKAEKEVETAVITIKTIAETTQEAADKAKTTLSNEAAATAAEAAAKAATAAVTAAEAIEAEEAIEEVVKAAQSAIQATTIEAAQTAAQTAAKAAAKATGNTDAAKAAKDAAQKAQKAVNIEDAQAAATQAAVQAVKAAAQATGETDATRAAAKAAEEAATAAEEAATATEDAAEATGDTDAAQAAVKAAEALTTIKEVEVKNALETAEIKAGAAKEAAEKALKEAEKANDTEAKAAAKIAVESAKALEEAAQNLVEKAKMEEKAEKMVEELADKKEILEIQKEEVEQELEQLLKLKKLNEDF